MEVQFSDRKERSLAKSSKIRVMISSRCNDMFPLKAKERIKLTDLRLKLKREIEKAELLGSYPYEVWVNEDATTSAERDSWEECMRQARECDIFLMLYNGNAGWKGEGEYSSVGICEAEFQTAYSTAPGKITIMDIFERDSPGKPAQAHDRSFQARIARENLFGPRPKDPAALEQAIRKAIVSRTIDLAQKGASEAGRGRGYIGPALDWKRLPYPDRRDRMIASALAGLGAKAGSDGRSCTANIDGQAILFRIGAVPDSLSIAAAREMVGQPHLGDDACSAALNKCFGGPVHVVACHRGATEARAQRMLGFPNATVVAAPFGIYVVDPVQAVQLVLIGNCVDDNATRLGVQRFLDWLPQSGQRPILVRVAKKRKEVVTLLARQP